MSAHLGAIPDFIQLKSLNDLREEKNKYQSKIESLWKEIKNDFKWTAEHPELSLKTITLLNADDQLKSDTLKVLKIIVAKYLQQELSEEVIRSVILDAVDEDNWDFILSFIEEGISPDLVITNGNTLLHLAIKCSKEKIVCELLEKRANPNIPNGESLFPLHLSVKEKLKNTCIELIKYKADINAVDESKKTPLHYATEWRHEDIARVLIAKGADVDLRNALGAPPVFQVIVKGSDELAIEFLEKMSFLDVVDVWEQSCLHIACCSFRTKIALTLIDHIENLNLCDKRGNTPLHYACKKSLIDVVDKLLEKKALPDIENHEYSYPFHTALEEKDSLILDCFARHLPPFGLGKTPSLPVVVA